MVKATLLSAFIFLLCLTFCLGSVLFRGDGGHGWWPSRCSFEAEDMEEAERRRVGRICVVGKSQLHRAFSPC